MRRVPVPLAPRALRWLGVLAVATVIWYYSLVTIPPAPPVGPERFWDKKLHFAAYAALSLSLAYATAQSLSRARRVALGVGVAILYGVGIEVGQGVLPMRYFSLLDLAANAVGALLGAGWFVVESVVRYVPVARSRPD